MSSNETRDARETLVSVPRTQDLWEVGYRTKGQKGRYQDQPQTLAGTQIPVDKPHFPKDRFPALKAQPFTPPQIAKAQPSVTPIFFKAPATNAAGQRFPPHPTEPDLSPLDNTRAPLPPQHRPKGKGRKRMFCRSPLHLRRDFLSHNRNNTPTQERMTSLWNGLYPLSSISLRYRF